MRRLKRLSPFFALCLALLALACAARAEDAPIDWGDPVKTRVSSGTGGTEWRPLPFDTELDADAGQNLALSDLFYDGFNYIDYINSFIMAECLNNDEDFDYEEDGYAFSLNPVLKRPFGGFPSDYPHFSVRAGATVYLLLHVDADNPYFTTGINGRSFSIPLTHDMSPFGVCRLEVNYLGSLPLDGLFAWGGELAIPSVRLDNGSNPQADDAVNQHIQRTLAQISAPEMHARFSASVNEPNFVFSTWRRYLFCGFLYGNSGSFREPNEEMVGAEVFDSHTGLAVDTEKWYPYLLEDPASCYFTDDADGVFADKEITGTYTPPVGTAYIGIWLRYGQLVLTFKEPDGTRVRVFAPLSALEGVHDTKRRR